MTPQTDRLNTALADRYTIDRELGAGGMATVYLAHDVKHDRDVAIKVLRPELAAVIGAERFVAEIRTTAHLQHPHILSLFDSGTVDGTVFYVMPFVEGESLRDRLVREKQLPVDDAVRIASEVADALHYAHQHGVIHRDIKPENILLHGGHAVVADFGIALAAVTVGGARMTETGMSLGTPAYMSPEQAMGARELDARTDVYALGCVLFEMLAGEPPFTGPTAQAIVGRVMTEPSPVVRDKRAMVPEHVSDAIQVALQKLPADRFRSAAEFGAALATPARQARALPTPSSNRWPRGGVAAFVASATAIAVAAFFLGGRLHGAHSASSIVFGHESHVTWDAGLEVTPALSPDGRFVAYASGPLRKMRVMVRPIGAGRAVPLTGDTVTAETSPQWSRDGLRILFLSRGGVSSAPAGGGPARPEVPGDPQRPITSATWSPDGRRLAFTRGDSLFTRERDASVRFMARMFQPALCTWSPEGSFVACATGNPNYAAPGPLFGNLSPSRIVLCRMRDGALSTLTDSLWLNTSPAWSADSRWLYLVSNRDGPRDVYGVSITRDGHAGGTPVRLSTGLGAHTISLSSNVSRVAFARYTIRSSVYSVPIPANPPATAIGATRITQVNEFIESISLSSDSKWLLYDSDLSGNADIFRVPANGGEAEQLTFDPADDFHPVASPDGREVAFHSWRSGSRDVFIMRLDGGGVQQVTHSPRQEAMVNWSPDGNALVFPDLGHYDGLWIVRRDAQGTWGEPRLRSAHGLFPVWSPDGLSIAFVHSVFDGSIEIVPVDSGPERTVMNAAIRGNPSAGQLYWADNRTIAFKANHANGSSSIWTVAAAGGAPRMMVLFDAALHSSPTRTFAMGNGRYYFTAEDRQSDVWVMEARQP